jgi:IPT/TIG domain
VTIAGITPNTGAANTAVTITGTNFTRDTQVRFGTTVAAINAVEAGVIVATVPGGPTGKVDVTVTSNVASAALAGAFTYEAAAPPPPPPNRTPDPPAGQLLPVPDMFWVVVEVANQYPGALRNSCQDAGGSWEFLDRVVSRLREFDTRWGYNCKRGNCPDISQDVVAYHAGAGPEVNGVLQTRTVDIVSGHCGPNPGPSWQPHAYGTGPDAAKWHDRFRGFSGVSPQ